MSNKVHMGHTARKRFGQNFLHDDYTIGKIVSAINPQQGQNLLEIGPGLGALTEPVADLVDKLQVVELDRDLAARLESHPFIGGKLSIYQGDAMKTDFSQFGDKQNKLRIFGNLPYNISTPLMFHLFEFADVIEDMHFMLQKEVVNRMAAGPGSKSYGRLTVMTQYFCQVIPVLEVGPEAFKPPPKVDSAVVRLVPKAQKDLEATSLSVLNQVCTEAFAQRRKTIRNSFKKLLTAEAFEELSLDPGIRPEQISVNQFVAIANWVSEHKKDA